MRLYPLYDMNFYSNDHESFTTISENAWRVVHGPVHYLVVCSQVLLTISNAHRLLVLNKFCIAISQALPLVPPMCWFVFILQSQSPTLSTSDSGTLQQRLAHSVILWALQWPHLPNWFPRNAWGNIPRHLFSRPIIVFSLSNTQS